MHLLIGDWPFWIVGACFLQASAWPHGGCVIQYTASTASHEANAFEGNTPLWYTVGAVLLA